jgi:hypothetical protein
MNLYCEAATLDDPLVNPLSQHLLQVLSSLPQRQTSPDGSVPDKLEREKLNYKSPLLTSPN